MRLAPPSSPIMVANLRRGLLVGGLLLFIALTAAAAQAPYFSWDPTLAQRLQDIGHPLLERLMIWVSVPGDGWIPWAMVGLTLLILLLKRWKAEAGFLLLGTGVGALANLLVKSAVSRPRPSEDHLQVLLDFHRESYPSGHVTLYVLYFGFLLLIARRKGFSAPWNRLLQVLCVSLIVLGGLSRVYLGAHWPSDVLAAYLGAGLGLWLLGRMYLRRTS